MKKLLTLTLTLLSLSAISQTFTSDMDSTYAPIETQTYVSPNKDTLIVPNNEFGEQIKFTWCYAPITQQPIIVTAPTEVIIQRNKIKTKKRK